MQARQIQKALLVTFLLLIFTTLIYAFTLVQETEVLTCTDTDYGLNESVRGTISGLTLQNKTYNKTDYCATQVSNLTLVEYACSYSNTTVKAQRWTHNCTNGCSVGKCS